MVSHVSLATEVYRIIDENGRVNYSQIPPYKGAEKITLKNSANDTNQSATVSGTSLQERQKKYSDFLESERLERKEKREKIKQERAQLTANCYAVQADLSDMNQGGVQYYDLDENGQRVYVDESIIEAKKRRLEKYLDSNCMSVIK